MGDVIYLDPRTRKASRDPDDVAHAMVSSDPDIERAVHIRDQIEEIMDLVTVVHNDPQAVAMAACRYGTMRLFQLQGRAGTMGLSAAVSKQLRLPKISSGAVTDAGAVSDQRDPYRQPAPAFSGW